MKFILAQLLGISNFVVGISCVHLKNIRLILAAEIFLNVATTLNFMLLPGALSGFLISVAACVHTSINMIYRQRKQVPPHIICILFSIVYVACALSVWSNPLDLLPAAAGVCFALSVHQSSPAGYRLCALCKSSIWILYCLSTRAYTLILTHVFLVCSALIALLHDKAAAAKS